jgi:hypothetical protein
MMAADHGFWLGLRHLPHMCGRLLSANSLLTATQVVPGGTQHPLNIASAAENSMSEVALCRGDWLEHPFTLGEYFVHRLGIWTRSNCDRLGPLFTMARSGQSSSEGRYACFAGSILPVQVLLMSHHLRWTLLSLVEMLGGIMSPHLIVAPPVQYSQIHLTCQQGSP